MDIPWLVRYMNYGPFWPQDFYGKLKYLEEELLNTLSTF